MKVIRPDLLADIIQLPEAERMKWEQVIDLAERFDTNNLREMAHQCDAAHDQEAYDRDCPAKGDETLDKYLTKTDTPTQDNPAPVPEKKQETVQVKPPEERDGTEQAPRERGEHPAENPGNN